MTAEAWLASRKQYWEDKRLADQTAKNTELNKNTTPSDQANDDQASCPPVKCIAVSMAPEEPRQADIGPCREDKALADERPGNTKFRKDIRCNSTQIS
ncbi:hypothetical protein BR93DRAFT_926525 [Coniochaeta sp. PMI_546]|nr:hypothetical protein BR93DRAFT_926525 [Coniochaeta sp. PMI_546]